MAFKKVPPRATTPASPDKLLLELPRRKIPHVFPHQKSVMEKYASEAVKLADVALQLPTGSGKTLVGLLIAEWRRRKFGDRVVYLCPTRQLVNQTVEQAKEKYGLDALAFVGAIKEYLPASKTAYKAGDGIAVTTYSSLFNTNPYFNDAHTIIVDDAHASENYVSSFWSVRILNTQQDHKALYAAMCAALRLHIDNIDYTKLMGKWQTLSDSIWVDKLPTPTFIQLLPEFVSILDTHTASNDLKYSWQVIRDSVHACHLYLSPNELVIRPLLPPTFTHPAFDNAKQRIYMSATLGAGGDLERLFGRKNIHRLPIPKDWDRQGVGRRFFIFPQLSLKPEELPKLRNDFLKVAGRSLILTPSDTAKEAIADEVKPLGYKVFDAKLIEDSKKPFIAEKKAVAIVANRYDGIDFPGEECRVLFVEGLPRATNSQEKFLVARMGANALLNERIQTRILQAIGRCTRSSEDYSAVVISGYELTDYLADSRRRHFLHPELQAELEFGLAQSKETTKSDLVENLKIFLANDKDWEAINQQIVAIRNEAEQKAFPAMDELSNVVASEIEYQTRLWQKDYEKALEAAENILGKLHHPELRGYRALWHYLAGSVAWMGAEAGISAYTGKARDHFRRAKDAAKSISWLAALSRLQLDQSASPPDPDDLLLSQQIENVENLLLSLGTTHNHTYAEREKEILEGLEDSDRFERAHTLLGELLGFSAGNSKDDGAPDPWWAIGSECIVFEDHADAKATSSLDITKARQVASHPNWIKKNVEACTNANVYPVLVTPVSTAHRGALDHLDDVAVWKLDDFKTWAINAVEQVRMLRNTVSPEHDLEWRARAMDIFARNSMAIGTLKRLLDKLRETKGLTEK